MAGKLNLLEAAEAALKAAGEPLNYRAITRRMLDDGPWSTSGRTPEASVNAEIAVEIKSLGAKARFVRTSPGVYGLRVWNSREPAAESEEEGGEALSHADAAQEILARADGETLHYMEVTRRAIELGLIPATGSTTAMSLYSQVLAEIKKDGEQARFRSFGRGRIGLARAPGRSNGAPEKGCSPPSMPSAKPAVIADTPEIADASLPFSDAAEQVLLHLSDGKPMHYAEIAQKAIDLGACRG